MESSYKFSRDNKGAICEFKLRKTGKTVTADLATNYDAETNTSLAEKIKNVREHNFEGGANNSELDNDTDRSNFNSKYPVSVIGFYWVQYL